MSTRTAPFFLITPDVQIFIIVEYDKGCIQSHVSAEGWSRDHNAQHYSVVMGPYKEHEVLYYEMKTRYGVDLHPSGYLP